jgi:hypothetical protein
LTEEKKDNAKDLLMSLVPLLLLELVLLESAPDALALGRLSLPLWSSSLSRFRLLEPPTPACVLQESPAGAGITSGSLRLVMVVVVVVVLVVVLLAPVLARRNL